MATKSLSPKCLLILGVGLTYVHTFFNIPPSRRWSLILSLEDGLVLAIHF